MSRSGAIVIVALAFALGCAESAAAQTLIPPLPGGDKERPEKKDEPECHVGASLVCAAGDLGSAAAGLVGDVAQAGAGAAADAVMGGVVSWAAGGAAWLLRGIGRQVERSTRPSLGSAWFEERYAGMRQLAIGLSLLFLLIAVGQAALAHDLRLLARACLVALPAALLLMFAAVTLVEIALAVTDELALAAVRGTGGNVRSAFADLARVLLPTAITGNPLPGFLLFLAALLTALLSLLVWLELVLREAAVYLAVAFLPLALSALVWARTAHWARRLAEWLAAIILAKVTIAVAFSLAGAMLGHGRGGSGGLSALLAGCAVLVLAAASPWVLLRLIPFTSGAAGSLHRGDIRGAVRQAPGATVATRAARQAGLGGASSAVRAAGSSGGGTARWAPASRSGAPR